MPCVQMVRPPSYWHLLSSGLSWGLVSKSLASVASPSVWASLLLPLPSKPTSVIKKRKRGEREAEVNADRKRKS